MERAAAVYSFGARRFIIDPCKKDVDAETQVFTSQNITWADIYLYVIY